MCVVQLSDLHLSDYSATQLNKFGDRLGDLRQEHSLTLTSPTGTHRVCLLLILLFKKAESFPSKYLQPNTGHLLLRRLYLSAVVTSRAGLYILAALQIALSNNPQICQACSCALDWRLDGWEILSWVWTPKPD